MPSGIRRRCPVAPCSISVRSVRIRRYRTARQSDSFTVACADGRIRVLRVKPVDGAKIGAAEFASTAKLAVGARLT